MVTLAQLVENSKQFHGAEYKQETQKQIIKCFEKAGFRIHKHDKGIAETNNTMIAETSHAIYRKQDGEKLFEMKVGYRRETHTEKREKNKIGKLIGYKVFGEFTFEVVEDYTVKSIEQIQEEIKKLNDDIIEHANMIDGYRDWKNATSYNDSIYNKIEKLNSFIFERKSEIKRGAIIEWRGEKYGLTGFGWNKYHLSPLDTDGNILEGGAYVVKIEECELVRA